MDDMEMFGSGLSQPIVVGFGTVSFQIHDLGCGATLNGIQTGG